MAEKLDRIDVKILSTLQAQGRITNIDLADEVGLSPSPCLARVKRLDKAGFIRGYHANLDVDRLCSAVRAVGHITLSDHSRAIELRLEQRVRELPQLQCLYNLYGEYDYIAILACRSVNDLNEVVDQLLADASLGISRMRTHIIMREVARNNGYDLRYLMARGPQL